MSVSPKKPAWWHRPPGWPLAIASLVVCGAWILEASTPQDGSPTVGVAIIGGIGLVTLAWIGRTMIAVAGRPRWSARYLAVPLIGLTTFGLVYVDAPFKARWAHAQPAFEHAAHSALRTGHPIRQHMRLGTFEVDQTVIDGTVRFRFGRGAIGDTHYIVYAANGVPHTYGPPSAGDKVTHIDGPWWRVVDMY